MRRFFFFSRPYAPIFLFFSIVLKSSGCSFRIMQWNRTPGVQRQARRLSQCSTIKASFRHFPLLRSIFFTSGFVESVAKDPELASRVESGSKRIRRTRFYQADPSDPSFRSLKFCSRTPSMRTPGPSVQKIHRNALFNSF